MIFSFLVNDIRHKDNEELGIVSLKIKPLALVCVLYHGASPPPPSPSFDILIYIPIYHCLSLCNKNREPKSSSTTI